MIPTALTPHPSQWLEAAEPSGGVLSDGVSVPVDLHHDRTGRTWGTCQWGSFTTDIYIEDYADFDDGHIVFIFAQNYCL